jgi:hypothetical protein
MYARALVEDGDGVVFLRQIAAGLDDDRAGKKLHLCVAQFVAHHAKSAVLAHAEEDAGVE